MTAKSELVFLDKDLWDYETTRYWMNDLRTEGNRRKMRKSFPDFIAYVKMDPDSIIAQRKEDLKSDDPKIRRRWEHIAKRFYHEKYEEREKQGKSTWTARTLLSAVQSFFNHNEYPLKFKRGELRTAYTTRKKYELSNEEARAIYTTLEKWRDKAMFLIAYQNGFLESDISNLNIEDFLDKDGNLKKAPVYFETTRQKTKTKIQTVFGKDVLFALERMIRVEGKRQKGPLFLSVHGRRIEPRSIRESIMPIAKEIAGSKIQFKDFRDAFHDVCNRVELNQRVIDALMGHAPLGARGSYRVREQTILEAYQKVYEKVTVNEVRAREVERLEEKKALEKKLQDLTEQVGRLTAMNKLIMKLIEKEYPEFVKTVDIEWGE